MADSSAGREAVVNARPLSLRLWKEAATRRYLGGDVNSATCTFRQVSASGKRLRQDVIDRNGQDLLEYIRSAPG